MATYPFYKLPAFDKQLILKPLIPIRLGSNHTHRITPVPLLALIDTGADACFCSTAISSWLRINTRKCKKQNFLSVNNQQFSVKKTHLKIYFNKQKFDTTVYVSNNLPKNYQFILGTKEFLEKFKLTLNYKSQNITFS